MKQALAQALRHSETLAGELRMVPAERDLRQERLKQSMRKLFAARSEASSPQQKDLFFNEAEALGAASAPAVSEDHEDDSEEVRAHKRVPRGR